MYPTSMNSQASNRRRRPLTPAERERRLRWLQNCYVATACYFPKEGTAEYNRDQIQTVEDLRRFPPAKAVDRVSLEDFDAYVSAEEDNPHGEQQEVDVGDGNKVPVMVRRPQKGGYILANWKDEKTGDYMCKWLISGNDEGLRQAADIKAQRKPQTSFAWRTEIIRDERGRLKDIKVIPDHIAVLGHEGHAPQYPTCKIVGLEPLCPAKNETLPRLQEMVQEIQTQQLERRLDDTLNELRSYVDALLEPSAPVEVVEEAAPKDPGMDPELVSLVRETLSAFESSCPRPEPEPVAAPAVVEQKAIDAPSAPPEPVAVKAWAPAPLASHFNPPIVDQPATPSPPPAVCASSTTFNSPLPSTTTTNMDASNNSNSGAAPASTEAAAPATTPAATKETAPTQQQQQQQKKTPLTEEELEAKINDLKKKYATGELKMPRIGEDGRADETDVNSALIYASLLSYENQLEARRRQAAEKRAEEVEKRAETVSKELESHKALGDTRYQMDRFTQDYNLRQDPAWKDAVMSDFYGGLADAPPQVRDRLQAGLSQLITTVCSRWDTRKRERDDSHGDEPVPKRQATYVDRELASVLNDTVERIFPSSSYSSSSTSSSSSAGSAPKSSLPYDINAEDYTNTVAYDSDRLLEARRMLEGSHRGY